MASETMGHVEQKIARLLIVMWGALAATLVAVACTPVDDIPVLELRAQRLNKVIMCPLCPGESIDQSQNVLAAQMRNIVNEKLEQGWTEDQVKNFFVERYGQRVLMEPSTKGFSLLVWLLPSIGALGAGAALILTLRLMRRPATPKSQEIVDTVQLSEQERDEYFERVETALDYNVGTANPAPESDGGS